MFRGKEEKIPEARKQEFLKKIRPIIAKTLDVSEEKITPSTNIAGDLGADSLDAIEIIMALEEAFNIEIFDDDAEKMEIIDDIITYLAQKVKL